MGLDNCVGYISVEGQMNLTFLVDARGAVLLVPTPCMLVGGWSVKNFGKNQKYLSTFGHYLRDILPFLEHKISNFRAARAKNWIERSSYLI